MSRLSIESGNRRGWVWLSRDDWLDVVKRGPAATYYHTPHWCECVANWQGGYIARALGFCLSDGARIALPVMVRRGFLRIGFASRGVSTMPNTYGGPVAEGRDLTREDWRDLFGSLHSLRLGRISIHATPGNSPPPEMTPDLAWHERNTYILRLKGIPGELVRRYHKGCTSSVKKGRRAGLTASRIDTPAALAEYYEVYLDSLKLWGKTSNTGYPFRLFQSLHDMPGVEVWGAKLPSGKIVAGGIFLYWNTSVQYWQGAMTAEHRDVCPANVLLDFVLEDARARGFQLFDFNPSGGLKGVEAFKASFGAAPMPSPKWTWRRPATALLPFGKRVAGCKSVKVSADSLT